MDASTIAFHLHLQSNGGNGHFDHKVAHHGQCEPSSKLILARENPTQKTPFELKQVKKYSQEMPPKNTSQENWC